METPIKISGQIERMAVSQRQMASALKLSTTRINQLIDEGILIRNPAREDGSLLLLESLQNYFLSKNSSSDESVNFWKERGLHEKAKRELAELKLAQARGEVYIASEVDAALAEILTDLRNQFLGLGHKLAMQLENKTAAQICDIIDGEITQNLKELAEELINVAEKESSGNQSGSGTADGGERG